MKKLLLLAVFILSVTLIEAQPTHVYARGGYSWLNGVLGGEVFVGHWSAGLGWMPDRSPDKEKMNSTCGFVSYHLNDGMTYDYVNKNDVYVSLGMASRGYQYLASDDTYQSEAILVVMAGYRHMWKRLDFKAGAGWGRPADDGYGKFQWEVGVGFKLF